MKTIVKLYIHQLPGEPQRAMRCDMSEFSTYGPLLGIREVEVEWQEIDRDPAAALLESLEAQVQKERADSQVRVNLLLERIGQLSCLEYKAGRAA